MAVVFRTGRERTITLSGTLSLPWVWAPMTVDADGNTSNGIYTHSVKYSLFRAGFDSRVAAGNTDPVNSVVGGGTPSGILVAAVPYWKKVAGTQVFPAASPYPPDAPAQIVGSPPAPYDHTTIQIEYGWQITVGTGDASATTDYAIGQVTFAMFLGGMGATDPWNGLFYATPNRWTRGAGSTTHDGTLTGSYSITLTTVEEFEHNAAKVVVPGTGPWDISELDPVDEDAPRRRIYREVPKAGGSLIAQVVVSGGPTVTRTRTLTGSESGLLAHVYNPWCERVGAAFSLRGGGSETCVAQATAIYSAGASETPLSDALTNGFSTADEDSAAAVSSAQSSITSTIGARNGMLGSRPNIFRAGLAYGEARSFSYLPWRRNWNVRGHLVRLPGTTDGRSVTFEFQNTALMSPAPVIRSVVGASGTVSEAFQWDGRNNAFYVWGGPTGLLTNSQSVTPWVPDISLMPVGAALRITQASAITHEISTPRLTVRGKSWDFERLGQLPVCRIAGATWTLAPGGAGQFATPGAIWSSAGVARSVVSGSPDVLELSVSSGAGAGSYFADIPHRTDGADAGASKPVEHRFFRLRFRSVGSAGRALTLSPEGLPGWTVTTGADGVWTNVDVDWFGRAGSGASVVSGPPLIAPSVRAWVLSGLAPGDTIQIEYFEGRREALSEISILKPGATPPIIGVTDGLAFTVSTRQDAWRRASLSPPSGSKPWSGPPYGSGLPSGAYPEGYWYDSDNGLYLGGGGIVRTSGTPEWSVYIDRDSTSATLAVDDPVVIAQDTLESVETYPGAGDVFGGAFGVTTDLVFLQLLGGRATAVVLGEMDGGGVPDVVQQRDSDGVETGRGTPSADVARYAKLSPGVPAGLIVRYLLDPEVDSSQRLSWEPQDREWLFTLWRIRTALLGVDLLLHPLHGYIALAQVLESSGYGVDAVLFKRTDIGLPTGTPPWSVESVVTATGGASEGNSLPALGVDGGRLLCLWQRESGATFDVYESESYDDGETWSAETLVASGAMNARIATHPQTGGILRLWFSPDSPGASVGTLKGTWQSAGDAAPSAVFTLRRHTGALVDLRATDAAFGLAFSRESQDRVLLSFIAEGDSSVSHWASADEGRTWSAL